MRSWGWYIMSQLLRGWFPVCPAGKCWDHDSYSPNQKKSATRDLFIRSICNLHRKFMLVDEVDKKFKLELWNPLEPLGTSWNLLEPPPQLPSVKRNQPTRPRLVTMKLYVCQMPSTQLRKCPSKMGWGEGLPAEFKVRCFNKQEWEQHLSPSKLGACFLVPKFDNFRDFPRGK